MITYCIAVAYSDKSGDVKIRSFQRAVLSDIERSAVDRIVQEHVARVENVKPAIEPPSPRPSVPRVMESTMIQVEIARASGFTGSVCECGSFRMVRTGTCEQCQDCFKPSGGCS